MKINDSRGRAPSLFDTAMVAEKRKRDSYESDVVTFLRRGELSIVAAIATKLPDVFTGEILNKLDLTDTLSLAQVSKSYRDAVWSVDGVRSMEAKIKAYVQNIDQKMFAEPMFWAAKYGNLPAVRALLKAGEGINKSLCRNNWTVLRVAAFHSHVALVKELIKAGADVNLQATDVTGPIILNYTALHLAAVTSHTTIIMELIKGGADVNIACSDGVTPLHIATEAGHEAGVVALMYAGADINAVMRDGHTPLSVAVHKKHERIVELLKHFGA